jgi:hypothetical protein
MVFHIVFSSQIHIKHENTVIKNAPNLIIFRNGLLHSTVKFYCIGWDKRVQALEILSGAWQRVSEQPHSREGLIRVTLD